jgi:RND family efflux transporter MFP subunit
MTRPLIAILFALFPLLAGTQIVASEEYLVSPVTVPVMKSVFGQVRSRDLVPARARIGGTLIEINVEEGDQVEAGQIIAQVVDDKLDLQLRALAANRQAVTAQLDNATTNLERAQQLFSRGTIAKSRLDELQTQFDVLTNQLRETDAQMAVIVEQSNQGNVRAPSAGRILSVPVTQGSVLLPGETVARIAGGGYFLRLSLPERHAAGINNGDRVIVGARGLTPGNSDAASVTGKLVKVYPEIENGRVIADVEVETLGNFFVGERVLVSIPIGQRIALAVPPDAITTRHGIDYVTIELNGSTTEVSVIPGAEISADDGALTEILTGLRAGDTVLLP